MKSCIAPADISEHSHLSLFDHCVLTLDCFSHFGLISACLLTLLPNQRAGRSSTTARMPLIYHRGVGNDFTSITSPSESAPLQPPVDPASQAPPPSHSTASPRVAYLEKFDGTPDKCKGFLLQCSLFVSQQPAFYPTEESCIAFLCSLLTGKALDWVTVVWNFNRPAFTSFERFLQRFRAVFELEDGAGEQILTLKLANLGEREKYRNTAGRREKYSSGVCSGFSHTGCKNRMAWWSVKDAFLQGIEPRVADRTRLSRRGKNFGLTDWSCHLYRQYDSLQETQKGFYFPFTKHSSCAWARGHASGTRTHLSWRKRSPVSSKSLSLLWPGCSWENLLSKQTQVACFLCGESVI